MRETLHVSTQDVSTIPFLETGFDFRQHLNGPLKSEGVIFGPTGRVVSQFVADIDAAWTGNSGELREHYRYASGATDDRHWTISLLANGEYTASATDLIGPGRGKIQGLAACSRYRIRLNAKGRNISVSAIDWMYLTENGVILNRSKFKKYGIKVAELFATLRPA